MAYGPGQKNAPPIFVIEPGNSALCYCGDVLQRGRARGRRYAKREKSAIFYEGQRWHHWRQGILNAPSHDIEERLSRALIGYVHYIDSGRQLELLAGEMGARADASRTKGELSRLLPCALNKFLDRANLQRRRHHQDNWSGCKLADWGEVFERIIRQVRVDRGTGGKSGRTHEQRGAVGWRLGNDARAQRGPRRPGNSRPAPAAPNLRSFSAPCGAPEHPRRCQV